MRESNFKFDKNCVNTAYLIGYLWADGWLDYKRQEYIAVSLEITTDDFRDCYEVFNKIEISHFTYYRERKDRKPQSTVRFSDKNFVNLLLENDYIDRRIKGFSKIINIFSDKSLPFFIKGLYDGDGCFYFNEKKSTCQTTLSSSVDQDYSGLEKLLLDNNVKFTIQRVTNKNSYSALRITSRKGFLQFIQIIFPAINTGLTRKNNKIKLMINKINKKEVH